MRSKILLPFALAIAALPIVSLVTGATPDAARQAQMIMAVGEDDFRSLSEIAAPPPALPAVEPSAEIVTLFVSGIPIPPLPATFAAQYPSPEDRALANSLWPAPAGGGVRPLGVRDYAIIIAGVIVMLVISGRRRTPSRATLRQA